MQKCASASAFRAGAGYVSLSSPGLDADPGAPAEVVSRPLPEADWAESALEDAERYGALAVGPGLGTAEGTQAAVRTLVAGWPGPIVVDGDGLTALGDTVADVTKGRDVPAGGAARPRAVSWGSGGSSPGEGGKKSLAWSVGPVTGRSCRSPARRTRRRKWGFR